MNFDNTWGSSVVRNVGFGERKFNSKMLNRMFHSRKENIRSLLDLKVLYIKEGLDYENPQILEDF